MKSLFEAQAYQEILDRLNKLEADSTPLWGKMTVGQMVWHCQIPLKVAIANKEGETKLNPLLRWLFKKSLYNDRPWRKNLPTSPLARAVEPRDFDVELPVLKGLVRDFHELKSREQWNQHPLFGSFTPQQWGQLQYKHLDHHLRQFGK